MKYERFEELPVWRAGMELAERVYALTDGWAFAWAPAAAAVALRPAPIQ